MKKQYIMRTCKADMTAYNGFVWPTLGYVEAPDWSPEPVCGKGLHGLLNGEGGWTLLDWSEDAKWLIAEVKGKVVNLDGKVKFQKCKVVFCGTRAETTAKMMLYCPGAAVVGASVTAGHRASITAGYGASITAGDRASIMAGYGASITAGHRASITAGDWASVTAGDRASITAGYGASITAGYGASITAGDRASVTAGDDSVFIFRLSSGFIIGVVGKDGILPNVAYTVKNGKIAEAK